MTDRPALATMVIQANPVPDPVATAEHLDAYQSLLALIDERSGAMNHHTKLADTTTPPPPTRNRAAAWAFAAAFIVVLVVIGAAALVLRVDEAEVTDEPVTVPPTVEPAVTPTTDASIEQVPVEDGGVPGGEWRTVVASEPWVERIVDAEPLPGGGYVAVASEPSPWSVIWSPDGITWHDADPYGQVPAQTKRVEALGNTQTIGRNPSSNHLVAVVGGRVVILDQLNTGVVVGDPQTGEWSPVGLDTRGLNGVPVPLAIAENDSRVLVAHAIEDGSVVELVFWLVDPATKASLGPFTSGIESGIPLPFNMPQVGWVGDRWIVMIPVWHTELEDWRNSLWASPDAETWTEVALPTGDSTWTRGAAFSALVTAPPGALLQRRWMGGGDTWYSPDGIEWQQVREDPSSGPVYSDTYGFVTSSDDATLYASDDGVAWQHLGGDWIEEAGEVLAASGRTVLQQLDVYEEGIRASSLVLWSEVPYPPTPTTKAPSPPAATTPTLPIVSQIASGERVEMGEVDAFVDTFLADWADAWIAGDAERISSMFSDDAVYVDTADGVEHHGRAEIEAALAAHFERASYAFLDLRRWGYTLPDTPDGPVLQVGTHWEWGGTMDNESFYAVPAMTSFHINYDDGTVLGCIHSDWE